MTWELAAIAVLALIVILLIAALVAAVRLHCDLNKHHEEEYKKARDKWQEWEGKASQLRPDNRGLNRRVSTLETEATQRANELDEGNKALKVLRVLNVKEVPEDWKDRASFYKVVPVNATAQKPRRNTK